MRRSASTRFLLAALGAVSMVLSLVAISCIPVPSPPSTSNPVEDPFMADVAKMVDEGRSAFRHATFGSEVFWGDTLGLHRTLAGEENGGVGAGVSPAAALALGLKVDVDALPEAVRTALAAGEVDLESAATTLDLLRLDAVVGVKGIFDDEDRLMSVGINCALCHSIVDNSFATGIGQRLDGWANRDLNVGAIMASVPDVDIFVELLGVDADTVRTVLNSWGPGKFDASLLIDGQAFHPDGGSAAVLIPPAFGLAGVNLATWTGWGSVPYWNAFVGNLEMGGRGTLIDDRLNDADAFPVAAANGFGNLRRANDRLTPALATLHLYQMALRAPEPPADSFDADAAARGAQLFNSSARCAKCHVPPLYTEPGLNLHTAAEIGIDDFQASRSPTGRYRTAPLKGLWTHTKGGFYHDGRFDTLADVVDHYDGHFDLQLNDEQKSDLIQFLMSL